MTIESPAGGGEYLPDSGTAWSWSAAGSAG